MKKVITIILSLFFLSSISSASSHGFGEGNPGNKGASPAKTITLSGKVVDQMSQEALAGALVRIEGTDLESYTDFEGNFTIKGIIPDSYKLQCSMISYTDVEEDIKMDQTSKEMVISLRNVSAKQACN